MRGPSKLRVPQVRVLCVLMPSDTSKPPSEWPFIGRVQMSVRAGYTAVSGTINRILHGIPEGSSSGDPHPGLLEQGLMEEKELDIDGLKEKNYRITPEGVKALEEYLAWNKLPEIKDKSTCINDRYRKQD